MAHTTGTWEFACDSYGKVRHSRKACVYSSIKGPSGDRLVTLAARIPHWGDARLMAAAPDLLAALRRCVDEGALGSTTRAFADAVIAKATT